MAGVERAKRALWSLLRTFKVQGSAKLTVSTAKGKLKVILEESFDVQPTAIKATKRPSPSQLRRKERRAADPAVQQRAAEHQAQVAATGEVLASPEKERASSALNPLQTSPVKDDVREETQPEREEEVAGVSGNSRLPYKFVGISHEFIKQTGIPAPGESHVFLESPKLEIFN